MLRQEKSKKGYWKILRLRRQCFLVIISRSNETTSLHLVPISKSSSTSTELSPSLLELLDICKLYQSTLLKTQTYNILPEHKEKHTHNSSRNR